MDDNANIHIGETSKSPSPNATNGFNFTLETSDDKHAPALVMHGFYNISSELSGKYSESLPNPVQVVVISKSTGKVYIQSLSNDDDIPSEYLGEEAQPDVFLETPSGPSTVGISESGYFTVNLKDHLALPDNADSFDVFLWLDDVVSDFVVATKRAELGNFTGSDQYEMPTTAVLIRAEASVRENKLAFVKVGDKTHLRGSVKDSSASLIVFSSDLQRPSWVTLKDKNGDKFIFDINLERVFNQTVNGKVMALLVIEGAHLPLAIHNM